MRVWFCLIMLLHCPLASAETLSERLASFSASDGSRALFIETWSAEYLEEPLVSKGELTYKRPGQLSKRITHPEPIEQRIEGDKLSIIYQGKTNSIQLSDQPELAAGIYALQAVLDGDEKNLVAFFEQTYSESDSGWKLLLTPRDENVADSIELIILQGNENRIQQVNIQFYNGDKLLTEISHER